MSHLRLNAFPTCCAINVISNFGYSSTALDKYSPDIKDIEEHLDQLIEQAGVGLLLVALDKKQKAKYADLMKEKEFRILVEDFYHPGHNSWVNLYALAIHAEKDGKQRPTKTKDSLFQKVSPSTLNW